jgi:endonuclease YncB( thermonuclease family)
MLVLLYLWLAISVKFASFEAKVIAVKDGDTIVVLRKGNIQETIRLAHIDCPEKKQPYGQKAKQFASDFCFGKMVKIIETSRRDIGGRMIGLVIYKDKCLNEALVSNGLAWHFKKYSKDMSYDVLEQKARAAKIGLWLDPNPIAPWDWRKIKRKK